MLKIKNKSEIEPEALTLLGASTKRTDSSKIGFFGSGSKYAIATLLRNGINVRIFSGDREIRVETLETEFRGQTFKKIIIDGVETGITTALGADWEVWQAIREIYCNAIDEGQHQVVNVPRIESKAGETHFYLEADNADALQALNAIIENWGQYFSDRREKTLVSASGFKVFAKEGRSICIFRKGIRVYDQKLSSLYDYDLEEVEINEARVAKWDYRLKLDIAKFWGKYATVEMIDRLFNMGEDLDMFENWLSWGNVDFFNENFLIAINHRTIVPRNVSDYFIDLIQNFNGLVLDADLALALAKFFGDKVEIAGRTNRNGDFYQVEPTAKETELIAFAKSFFQRAGLNIEYPIHVVVFKDPRTMGLAEDKKIYIAKKALEMGKKYVCTTILEECMHNDSGFGDETRHFQDYIINKVVSLFEDKVGETL